MRYWENPDIPPLGQEKTWIPKNPDIAFNLRKEVHLTDDQWQRSSFPHRDLPPTIENHVDLKNWREKVQDLSPQIQERSLSI